jgi:hypothetical protein
LRSQHSKINKFKNEHESSLSLKEARAILNKDELKHTDFEVEEIRDFMQVMAEVIMWNDVQRENTIN